MIGMQLVMQHFADGRLRIIPGMFAEWAIVADCRPDFFECAYFVFAHFYDPMISFFLDTDLHGFARILKGNKLQSVVKFPRRLITLVLLLLYMQTPHNPPPLYCLPAPTGI